MANNPLKTSDLFQDDGSIDKAIKAFLLLETTLTSLLGKTSQEAAKLLGEMKKVNIATDEGRAKVKQQVVDADLLAAAEKKYQTELDNLKKKIEALTKTKESLSAQQKLEKKEAEAAAGSYDKLSAQYSLMKIKINAMGESTKAETKIKREAEIQARKLYEQMNKLQQNTGKFQLQVGQYKEAWSGVVGVFSKVVGGLAAAGITMDAFKKVMNTTEAGADKLREVMSGVERSIGSIYKTIYTGDFGNLLTNMQKAYDLGVAYEQMMDRLGHRKTAVDYLTKSEANALAELEERARNVALPNDVRSGAMNEWMDTMANIEKARKSTVRQDLDAQIKSLAITNMKADAVEELLKNYLLLDARDENLRNDAEDYNEALKERKLLLARQNEPSTTGYMGVPVPKTKEQIAGNESAIAANAAKLAGFSPAAISYAGLLDKIEGNKSPKRIAEAIRALGEYNSFEADAYQNRKKLTTMQASLDKKAADDKVKAVEDYDKAVDKSFDDQIKQAEESKKLSLSILQSEFDNQNQSIDYQQQYAASYLEAENKLQTEVLKIKLAAGKITTKEYAAELINMSNKQKELTAKQLIDKAKFDADAAKVVKDTNSTNYKAALEVFDQEQDLEKTKFEMLKSSEAEKTKFTLQQEKARLLKILELSKLHGQDLTALQIANIQATIQKIDQEMGNIKETKKDIYSILGLNLDDKAKQAISESINTAIGFVKEGIQANIKKADTAVSASEKEIDAAQNRLNAELDARNAGYASNVKGAEKDLQLAKDTNKKALKEKEKALRAQLDLDTALQTSSLITASANIWKSFTGLGVWGIPLAIASMALMWGSFLSSKQKAYAATRQTYGDGGMEILDGGSHSSGDDVDLGMTKTGKARRGEGGEAMIVVNKRNTARYRAILPEIVKALNKGEFENRFIQSNLAENPANFIVNTGTNNPEFAQMNAHLREIKEQGNRRMYVDSKGRTVVMYKNVRTTYV